MLRRLNVKSWNADSRRQNLTNRPGATFKRHDISVCCSVHPTFSAPWIWTFNWGTALPRAVSAATTAISLDFRFSTGREYISPKGNSIRGDVLQALDDAFAGFYINFLELFPSSLIAIICFHGPVSLISIRRQGRHAWGSPGVNQGEKIVKDMGFMAPEWWMSIYHNGRT